MRKLSSTNSYAKEYKGLVLDDFKRGCCGIFFVLVFVIGYIVIDIVAKL